MLVLLDKLVFYVFENACEPRFTCDVFREKVNIPPLKSFITIQGAGADKTIVQWGDTAKTLGPRGQPLGTFASASFAVNSPYFIAKNITFKVSFFDLPLFIRFT